MKKNITLAQMVTRVFYSIGCMLLIAGLLLSYVTKPAFASEEEPGSEPPATQDDPGASGDQGGDEGGEVVVADSGDESLEPTEQEDENAAPQTEAPAGSDGPSEEPALPSDEPQASSGAPMMAFSSSSGPNPDIDSTYIDPNLDESVNVNDECNHYDSCLAKEDNQVKDGGNFTFVHDGPDKQIDITSANLVVLKTKNHILFFVPKGPGCSGTYCVTWNTDEMGKVTSITITRAIDEKDTLTEKINNVTFWFINDEVGGDDDVTDDDDTSDDDDVTDDDDTTDDDDITQDDDDVTDDDDTTDDDDVTQDDDDVTDDDDTNDDDDITQDDDDVTDDDDTTDDDDVTQDDDDVTDDDDTTDDDDIVTSDDDDDPRIERDPGDPGVTVAAVVPTLAAPAVPVAVDSAQLIPVTGGDMTSPSFFELELNQVQDLMTHFGLVFIGAAVALQTLTRKQTL